MKKRRTRNQRRILGTQRGLTLFEILIVLAILGLVFGLLLGPRIMGAFGDAQEDTAKLAIKNYMSDMQRWRVRNVGKDCPSKITDLIRGSKDSDFNDPWGNQYVMHCGSTKPPKGKYGFSSMGSDGKANTGDDIKSWELE